MIKDIYEETVSNNDAIELKDNIHVWTSKYWLTPSRKSVIVAFETIETLEFFPEEMRSDPTGLKVTLDNREGYFLIDGRSLIIDKSDERLRVYVFNKDANFYSEVSQCIKNCFKTRAA